MEVRFQQSPKETSQMNTQELRENFLMEQLVQDGKINLVYSHYDRVIVGGAKPLQQPLQLETDPELRAEYFLERREIGIINVGGAGQVIADGVTYDIQKLDCVYLGKGTKQVSLASVNAKEPAVFYLLSSPAHQTYPNTKFTKEQALPAEMGSQATANKRTIYKYIHADGIQSAQLVMGLTILTEGNVWNTMPSHVHTRRMEAYFYFDVQADQRVFHFMGQPTETRHLLVANHQAIVSPPWSIHSGCGTASYGFIWGMAGENYTYTDMDPAPLADLR
jgi:4-deoxy-L-threo-5-hexosulose-uronate ketol-isomerase